MEINDSFVSEVTASRCALGGGLCGPRSQSGCCDGGQNSHVCPSSPTQAVQPDNWPVGHQKRKISFAFSDDGSTLFVFVLAK